MDSRHTAKTDVNDRRVVRWCISRVTTYLGIHDNNIITHISTSVVCWLVPASVRAMCVSSRM